jgi:hypothetical protein
MFRVIVGSSSENEHEGSSFLDDDKPCRYGQDDDQALAVISTDHCRAKIGK